MFVEHFLPRLRLTSEIIKEKDPVRFFVSNLDLFGSIMDSLYLYW